MIVLKGRPSVCALLLWQGYRPKEIAKQMGISPRTVKEHFKAAYRRAGIEGKQWNRQIRLVYLMSKGEVVTE